MVMLHLREDVATCRTNTVLQTFAAATHGKGKNHASTPSLAPCRRTTAPPPSANPIATVTAVTYLRMLGHRCESYGVSHTVRSSHHRMRVMGCESLGAARHRRDVPEDVGPQV